MKVSLKQRLNLFPKLRRRLSSIQWILLLITTAMFFLSAASNACTFSFGNGGGGPIVGAASPPNGAPPSDTPAQPAASPAPSGGAAPPPAAPPPAAPPDGAAQPAASPAPSDGAAPPPAAPPPAAPPDGAAQPAASPAPDTTASGPPPSSGGDAQEIDMITMSDAKHSAGFAFSPETVTIKKGTKVTWVNKTKAPHDVTSDKATGPGSFPPSPGGAVGVTPTGATSMYSFTFAMAGTYTYSCVIHPGMVGTITVT